MLVMIIGKRAFDVIINALILVIPSVKLLFDNSLVMMGRPVTVIKIFFNPQNSLPNVSFAIMRTQLESMLHDLSNTLCQ